MAVSYTHLDVYKRQGQTGWHRCSGGAGLHLSRGGEGAQTAGVECVGYASHWLLRTEARGTEEVYARIIRRTAWGGGKMSSILKVGYPCMEELRKVPGFPSEERMRKGPVAVIECVQEIPCNPCQAACPKKAITIGENITHLPVLDQEVCIGCGICISRCPGLAIFVAVSYTHLDVYKRQKTFRLMICSPGLMK